jgi:ferredoxin
MAQALARAGLDYQLHYFVQSEDHLAFPERIERLGSQVLTHIGMGPAETVRLVEELLGTYDSLSQVYTCGPPAMIGEVRSTASNLGWPLETIHYEYFKNETVVDSLSAFEIDLARSGMTLFVEGGKTILEVLRENGVTLPSSCEQGACGTCEVAVLEGLPHHQDVYLNESEHAAGDRIMTCISRAHSERLVLDI